MYDVLEVAKFFLIKEKMNRKKLCYLVYLAYSWYLTIENATDDEKGEKVFKKLFDEEIKAWIHGPMILKVYEEYKSYGYYNDIPKISNEKYEFNEEALDVLEQVWEVYGQYNGIKLSSITAQHDPWNKARKGYASNEICEVLITDKDIYNYYIKECE